MPLDLRTILVSNVITDAVCILVVAALWRQSRNRFAGTGHWILGFACQLGALLLIALRGHIPDMMSMVASNTLVIAGAMLVYRGLGRFVGKRTPQIHNYVLLGVFATIHTYFVLVQPDLAVRNLNVSLGILIIVVQSAWLALRRVDRSMRGFTRGVGAVFVGYGLVSGVRIAEFFIYSHDSTDYFLSGPFEALVLVSYQMLLILHTVTLVLMVNKRLLAEVSSQEEKFSKAFRCSPYVLTLTRLSDGLITDVNEGFVVVAGYPHAEVIHRTSTELHLWDRPEDRAEAAAELRQSGKVHWRKYQFRKKSGTTFPGLFSAEVLQIENEDYVLSSINDITERERDEEALRAYGLELKSKNEELTRFSYAVSHDLKSPVVTIRSFLDFLRRDLAANDAQLIDRDLRFIQTATEKMGRLLNELLELASIGRTTHVAVEVSLQSIVQEALALVAGQIADGNVTVVVTVQPYLVTGDTERLIEVFQNLLDNASKFMGEQSAPRIEIGVDSEGPEPVIFVRDNGIGIETLDSSELFGAFKKLDPRAEGSGIGLALVQRIVEMHGGRIRMESAGIGQGATFSFTLAGTRRAPA